MKIGGKQRKFKFGLNGIRTLVRESGKTPQEILEQGFDPRDLEYGVTLIWAGLLWQDQTITMDQVGEWLDAEDRLYLDAAQEAINALLEGFKRSFGLKEADLVAEGEKESEEEESEKN